MMKMSSQNIEKKLEEIQKEISQIFGFLKRMENKIDKLLSK
jgi:hypothetical protein